MGGRPRGASERPSGADVRQAWRSKHLQDLLYRSEYLATIVSPAAALEEQAGQKLQTTLAASCVPRLVNATGERMRSRLSDTGAPLPLHIATPRGLETQDASGAPPAFEHVPGPKPTTDPLHGLTAWEETCNNMATMLATTTALADHASDRRGLRTAPATFRVRQVPRIPDNAFCEDHKHAARVEWVRHAHFCTHVDQLSGDGPGDTSGARLQFAQLLSRRRLQESVSGGTCFCRADGKQGESTTHKFSVMEAGTVLVRHKGQDPFHSHALASTDRPASVAEEGHYFEVKVLSSFRAPPRQDGQRHLEPARRTEGLVVGVTAAAPSALAGVSEARLAPMAWCVATSGTFYASGAGSPRAAKRVGLERVKEPPSWHRKALRDEQLSCSWPLPHVSAAEVRRLGWCAALDEGDSLGMLVTPSGGIVITVNGHRQLLIPDAGVPSGVDLHPLIEVYNHVRTVQLVMSPRHPS
mmetsp:Transcript_9693/g.28621  ORF Transcript_9693/g.28621 Transcript_9693/m.28621 type:complete len:469 (-) Transcript_9693:179-1585(-)